jgi:hypothetical protein
MKVPRRLREHVSLTINLLDGLGIEWTIDMKHKHPRLLYSVDGKGFMQIVSGSSSDTRSAMNMRSDVIKTIRRERGKEQ